MAERSSRGIFRGVITLTERPGLLPLMPAYDKAWVKIAAFGVGMLSLLLLCPSALALDPSIYAS